MRWKPFKLSEDSEEVDFVKVSSKWICVVNISKWFIQGISTVCGAGDPRCRSGCVVYVYTCNSSMKDK